MAKKPPPRKRAMAGTKMPIRSTRSWKQFTVNLADEQFLQTDIQLRLADRRCSGEDQRRHAAIRMPIAASARSACLSSKTAEELAQPEGKAKLAQEVQESDQTTYLV